MFYRASRLAVVIVALGLMSSGVRAEEEKPGEIGALWGISAADADLTGDATEDFTFGVRGAYHFNPQWIWFGEGLYAKFDSTSPTVDPASVGSTALVPSNEDVETLSVRAGLQYMLTQDRSRNWFLSVGAGWLDVTRSDLLLTSDGMGGVSQQLVSDDFNRLFASLGGGQRYSVSRGLYVHWEIRFDQTITLRSVGTEDEGVGGRAVGQGHLLAGLSWGIGARRDADADGVADRSDRCPETPQGAFVDALGCPTDADGDGVADGIDTCPETPQRAQVDAVGCPTDGDDDGVADGIDECPQTSPGVAVGETGCSELAAALRQGQAVRVEGVVFEVNSETLTPDSYPVLEQWALVLQDEPTLRIEIGGHTDDDGAEAHNLKLSTRRATAVQEFLVSRGVDGSQLEVRGYGESQPLGDNATEEGRAMNRRVVFKSLE